MGRASAVFVTGIGTDVGKTLVSAGLCLAWNAKYWKPFQSGASVETDRARLVSEYGIPESQTLPEAQVLQSFSSPHHAAKQEGLSLDPCSVKLPQDRPLVVEGAGGLLVPLNEKDTVADFIQHLKLPVVLVINHYLGAINHSLLSLAYCKHAGIPIQGLVFSGVPFLDNKEIICTQYPNVPVFPDLPQLEDPKSTGLRHWAREVSQFNAVPYVW